MFKIPCTKSKTQNPIFAYKIAFKFYNSELNWTDNFEPTKAGKKFVSLLFRYTLETDKVSIICFDQIHRCYNFVKWYSKTIGKISGSKQISVTTSSDVEMFTKKFENQMLKPFWKLKSSSLVLQHFFLSNNSRNDAPNCNHCEESHRTFSLTSNGFFFSSSPIFV